MKLNSTRRVTGACLALSMLLQPAVTHAGDEGGKSREKKVAGSRSKVSTSRNNSSVRIFPDAIKRVMHVVAKDNDGEIDFFVFDLEGTIIKHYRMKSGEHQRIDDLGRGKYIFRVFSGDEETAMGNLEIR